MATPRQIQTKWIMVIIGIFILGFVVVTTRVIYQENLVSGSTDIYPTWQGGKLFWQDGVTPYKTIVGEKSQEAIYGRLAEDDEDEFQYVYPFYLILYMGPLPLLEFKLAAAILLEILLILLVVCLVMTLDFLQWLPKPIPLGMAILLVLISYFSVRGFLLAQPAFLAYGFHIGAYWALSRRYDGLTGGLLALSTIKPQTGFLLVPLLIIWAWVNHRRMIVYGFAGVMGVLFMVSFALYPAWLFDWIERAATYSNYTETLPTAYVVTHVFDSLPKILTTGGQVLLSILILIPVAQFWKTAILEKDNRNFLWGLMVTMTATLLIAPRVATTYYVELYPAIVVGMMILERRGKIGWIVIGSIVFIIGYWALHIATAPPVEDAGKEAPIVYIVFPILMYLWLVWRRSDWEDVDILRREGSTASSDVEAEKPRPLAPQFAD